MYSFRDTGTGGHLVLSYRFHVLSAGDSLVSAAIVPMDAAAATPPAVVVVGKAGEEDKRKSGDDGCAGLLRRRHRGEVSLETLLADSSSDGT